LGETIPLAPVSQAIREAHLEIDICGLFIGKPEKLLCAPDLPAFGFQSSLFVLTHFHTP
jgi:hypothetical protein